MRKVNVDRMRRYRERTYSRTLRCVECRDLWSKVAAEGPNTVARAGAGMSYSAHVWRSHLYD